MWPDTQQHRPNLARNACILVGLISAVLMSSAKAQEPREEQALPKICDIPTNPDVTPAASAQQEPEDCYEFGAAVGELSWGWRQKLPAQVRWLQRQDAATLCQQSQSDLGQKVGPAVSGGCIFLSANACTVITPAYLAPALLSNAIRHCVP
jgi:hypothetical protein